MKKSRRKFLKRAVGIAGMGLILPSLVGSCTNKKINGKILGPNAALGHRLRSMDFPAPSETMQIETLIIGGGVSGLSAARQLKKANAEFLLLELDENCGGNSMGGSNSISSFPWGAHYLPLPSNNDPALFDFLKDVNVITGTTNGLPVYNEYYLCHDPKERLYINNLWQDSLIPHEGLPQKDRDQIQAFLTLMHDYKILKGNDGKEAFTIPVCLSSQDPQLLSLDSISAFEFLTERNLTSDYLHWYVNYCCADDYGSGLKETSAWAMIHYFASRKGQAANATPDAVLTWPEGNYWLVKKLKEGLEKDIRAQSLAYDVTIKDDNVEVLLFDGGENRSIKIICRSVIMATPQYINQRILKIDRAIEYDKFEYSPWMVANITTDHTFSEKRGEKLCWDNVIYGNESLGYVNAQHQQVGFQQNKKVITYYRPLLSSDVNAMRHSARTTTFEDWRKLILSDLKKPHHDIENHIEEINVWIWGHGMVKPSPGFVWSENRKASAGSIDNKIHFAHSDVSGISIFEEAFFNGHQSAKAVLKNA